MGEPVAQRRMYQGLTREQVETLNLIDQATTAYRGPNELSTVATNKDLATLLAATTPNRVLTTSAMARRIRNLQDKDLIVTYYEQKIDGRFDKRTIEMTLHGLNKLEALYIDGTLGISREVAL